MVCRFFVGAVGAAFLAPLVGGLADGFREAFKKYFRIVPASAAPDWTLNIVKAKPTLAPTSLGRHVTLVAEITFQATLMRAGALPRRSGRRSPRDARWSSWTPLNRSRAPSR
jgi:hypothetical protein